MPSAFKPPPRVMITESRRDAWLSELANPSIPLRKLGRTVPHDLKGKVLLGQLYKKKVPIGRALWLIKCVGASELKTLKRKHTREPKDKGKAAEIEWLQDWTSDVIDFVETSMDRFPQNPTSDLVKRWDAQITYAVALAIQLLQESLIDTQYFNNWLTQSLQTADIRRVPVLLLLTNMIWPSLQTNKRMIKHVLKALCTRYETINKGAVELLHGLDSLLLRLFQSSSEAFVYPELWPALESNLRRATANIQDALFGDPEGWDTDDFLAQLDTLSARNNVFIVTPTDKYALPKEWSAATKIGAILSSLRANYSITALINDLRTLKVSSTSILNYMFSWVAERDCEMAVYACFNVCQALASSTPISDNFSSFLTSLDEGLCNRSVYCLIAWLYKANMFSIETYFRRLIASGVMHLPSPQQKVQSNILRNLPYLYLSRALQSQARMLLREEILTDTNRVNQLAETLSTSTDIKEEMFPSSMTRDFELRLSDALIVLTKNKLRNDIASINVVYFDNMVWVFNRLRNKFALFKVLWMFLSMTDSPALTYRLRRVMNINCFYWVSMNVVDAIVQHAIDQATRTGLEFEQTTTLESSIKILQASTRNTHTIRLLDTVRALRLQGPNMSPESLEDELAGNVDVSADALIEKAMSTEDISEILQLKKVFAQQSTLFVKKVGEYVAKNPNINTEFAIRCIANNCLSLSDTYTGLIDKNNDALFTILFAQNPCKIPLSYVESTSLTYTREFYVYYGDHNAILEFLGRLHDCERLCIAVRAIIKCTHYDPDDCAVMLRRVADSPGNKPVLGQMVAEILRIKDSDASVEDRFFTTLERCNPYNVGFCRFGVWLLFSDMAPENVAGIVLKVVKSGRVPTSAQTVWKCVFSWLSPETNRAIYDACKSEFLSSPVPHPLAVHISQIIDALEAFSNDASEEVTVVNGERLLSYLANVVQLCMTSDVTADAICTTVKLLLKLLITEFDTANCSSNMCSTTIKLLKQCLNTSVFQRTPELSAMIVDAINIINEGNANASVPSFCNKTSLDGLKMYSRSQDAYTNLEVWPFDLIEENATGTDVPIDLSLFETYIELKDTS